MPDIQVETSSGANRSRVSWRTVGAYGAPGFGVGYMYLLMALYVMKFSTDVLLIAPAVMGIIFSASRIWDAISDPLVGYLSDRTRGAMGRRRTWLLASTIPVMLSFTMVLSPPHSLTGGWLTFWMAVAIIGFYSSMTLFLVPHLSLGAELTSNYHERSRLFGIRHATFTGGSILALVSMQLFINAEQEGSEAVRIVASNMGLLASGITGLLILYAVVVLREPAENQGRVSNNPARAFRDVWQNPHARLLIIVTFIENIGSAAIGVLTLYIAQYVVGRPVLAPLIILFYMVPSTFSVPLWIPLSRRIGKIRLWMFSMLLTGCSFGGMFFLVLVDSQAQLWIIFSLAFTAGLAAGCGGTVAPSIQGDVIDYDELITGERKEGSYFSAWNFVYKSAYGVMLLMTGFILQLSGFVPNQEQTPDVKLAMVSLYGLLPFVFYVIGAILFSRFKLNEAAHAEIRSELDRRAAGSGSTSFKSPE